MANQLFPSVNGIDPSWSDIQITFNVTDGVSLTIDDIAGVKATRKVDVAVSRGASGGRPKRRTTGSVEYDASLNLYRSGRRKLIKALIPIAESLGHVRGNQTLIALVTFDVLIQHTPPGETEIYSRKVKGARYLGDTDDMKEGNEADQQEVPLSVIEIVDIIDGKEIALI